jgi:hypothetical protein
MEKFKKKLKVCNFKKNIKYLEMEKYKKIQEKLEIYNIRKNIWKKGKIENQRLKRVSN